MASKRHSVFDEVADLYGRARPSYPDALVDDLVALSGIPDGGRILEIGCGTGQMTLPLARRGYRVDAIELGPALATVATRNLSAFLNAAVHNVAFESWRLPRRPFDLVVSATAFHWISPRARFEKTARALKPSGTLAVVETHHVSGRDDGFFHEVQRCYEAHMPGTEPGITLTPAEQIAPKLDGMGSKRFAQPVVRTYPWEATYTTDEYLDVLRTYSGHIELPPGSRDALYGCIRELLDGGALGGRVRKQYLFALMVAKRR